MTSSLVLSNKKTQWIVWVLLLLTPIIGMNVDLLAPSLPVITTDLSASPQAVKGIISIYLLGYALGNFVTGFISDAFGRRFILRLALLGFAGVSLLPVLLPSMPILLLSRLMQGLLMGACAVVIRSVFADILPAERLLRMGTLLGTMWGLGPVIGPMIGGYLQVHLGWKANFGFFALLSVLAFVAVYKVLPETLGVAHPFCFASFKRNLLEVLRHRFFVSLSLMMGIVYSLIISFNTLGPFLIEDQLGYSPLFFGRLALGLGIIFLIATFVCRHVIQYYSFKRLVFMVVHIFFLFAMAGVLFALFSDTTMLAIAILSAGMYFVSGFIFPLSMGRGMSMFRHMAGTATATMYLINVLLTSTINVFVGWIHVDSMQALFLIYVTLLSVALVIYWVVIHPCVAKP